jgi:hypothetical protein
MGPVGMSSCSSVRSHTNGCDTKTDEQELIPTARPVAEWDLIAGFVI